MPELNDKQAALIRTIKSRGVSAVPILEAMESVDRNEFLHNSFSSHAYDDIPLPIARGQMTSQPTIVGIMIQELKIRDVHRVLEVGTGSGYQTMILSLLCRHVYSVERFRSLASSAKKLVIDTHLRQNVSIVHSDGANGLKEAAPFDRIIVGAASEEVPPLLLEQLKPNGIMVLPIGRSASEQCLMKVTKSSDGEIIYYELGAARFVPLLEGVDDE